VRVPDVSFVSWSKLADRRIPDEPIPNLVPDLAVEVLSRSNTPREMERKLRDYFRAGVRLVWYVEPALRQVRVFTAADQSEVVAADGMLRGGDVLPGFELSMRDWFERAERPSGPKVG
jgi:Uma2 family endonuclease